MVERANKPSSINPTSKGAQPAVNFNDDNSILTATLPSGESVDVLLHGATITSWKNADGSENLWLSEAAILNGSKPVRGGIPVVFPVFGAPPNNHATTKLPQHGFARQVRWEFLGKSSTESEPGKGASDNGVKLDFGLYSKSLPENYTSAWPYDFGVVYSVTLSPEGLRTIVNVRNEGSKTFEFQVLLHTYLRVKDVTTTSVTGLLGVEYKDKVLNASDHTESSDKIRVQGEMDRVYKNIPQDTTTVLEGDKPRYNVVRDNLTDTVLWNPWTEKAKGMGDFEPKDGWKHMMCVEVGAVAEWQSLDGGESWEGGQVIKSLL